MRGGSSSEENSGDAVPAQRSRGASSGRRGRRRRADALGTSFPESLLPSASTERRVARAQLLATVASFEAAAAGLSMLLQPIVDGRNSSASPDRNERKRGINEASGWGLEGPEPQDYIPVLQYAVASGLPQRLAGFLSAAQGGLAARRGCANSVMSALGIAALLLNAVRRATDPDGNTAGTHVE